MQLIPPKAPSLPLAPGQYERSYQDRLLSVLRQYFNTVDVQFQQLLFGFNHYGTFYDTTTQTAAAPNTAYPLQMNTTGEAFGISVTGTPPTRITVTREGVYNFQFSAQLDNIGGGTHHAHFWFRVSGTDVADSASKVVVSGPNAETVAAWNYMLRMAAGDYFELMWAVDSTDIILPYAAAAAPVPAIPSLIMTAQYVYPDGNG